jgi:hypothetical protein
MVRHPRRPAHLKTEAEIFAWFMPGDPPEQGCWDWSAGTDQDGYGQVRIDGKTRRSHVISHKIFNGPVGGLHVLHSCDRPVCVNPAHLHLGTISDNISEMVARRRNVKGERTGNARLTEEGVRLIRQSDLTNIELGKILGVHHSTVSLVRLGRRWGHVH